MAEGWERPQTACLSSRSFHRLRDSLLPSRKRTGQDALAMGLFPSSLNRTLQGTGPHTPGHYRRAANPRVLAVLSSRPKLRPFEALDAGRSTAAKTIWRSHRRAGLWKMIDSFPGG